MFHNILHLSGSNGSEEEQVLPPPKPARPQYPNISPATSARNLSQQSVASPPNHWGSASNLPLSQSTPVGPSPQMPPPPSSQPGAPPLPREIDLSHYFPSSTGYTQVNQVSRGYSPSLGTPEGSHYCQASATGPRGGTFPGRAIARTPQELSEMVGNGSGTQTRGYPPRQHYQDQVSTIVYFMFMTSIKIQVIGPLFWHGLTFFSINITLFIRNFGLSL